jgi:hypothetical protein
MRYATIQPASATGIMCSAYVLKLMPARYATTRFIGLPVGSGATPAATNAQNANGSKNFGLRFGYTARSSSMTTGVSSRIAASFERIAAVSAATMKKNRNACFTGPRVRGSIAAARRVKMPSSAAHAVVAMIPTMLIMGRHRSPSACAMSSVLAMPAPSANPRPVSAPTAGAQGLRHASAITRATAIAATASTTRRWYSRRASAHLTGALQIDDGCFAPFFA